MPQQVREGCGFISGQRDRRQNGIRIMFVINRQLTLTAAIAQNTNVPAAGGHDIVTNSNSGKVNFFDAYTHDSTVLRALRDKKLSALRPCYFFQAALGRMLSMALPTVASRKVKPSASNTVG